MVHFVSLTGMRRTPLKAVADALPQLGCYNLELSQLWYGIQIASHTGRGGGLSKFASGDPARVRLSDRRKSEFKATCRSQTERSAKVRMDSQRGSLTTNPRLAFYRQLVETMSKSLSVARKCIRPGFHKLGFGEEFCLCLYWGERCLGVLADQN